MASFVLSPSALMRPTGYHSHPHWQRTDWLRWDFSITFLHMAHNLIHITYLRSVLTVGSVRLIAIPESSTAARPRGSRSPRIERAARTLRYFPILPFTLPIPVQRSQPNLAEKPAVGPQKPLPMSLKSVVIAKLL